MPPPGCIPADSRRSAPRRAKQADRVEGSGLDCEATVLEQVHQRFAGPRGEAGNLHRRVEPLDLVPFADDGVDAVQATAGGEDRVLAALGVDLEEPDPAR